MPRFTTNTAYNADSLATSVTDANSHATTQTYDNNGRRLVTTKANGDTFTNTYDSRHEVAQVIVTRRKAA